MFAAPTILLVRLVYPASRSRQRDEYPMDAFREALPTHICGIAVQTDFDAQQKCPYSLSGSAECVSEMMMVVLYQVWNQRMRMRYFRTIAGNDGSRG